MSGPMVVRDPQGLLGLVELQDIFNRDYARQNLLTTQAAEMARQNFEARVRDAKIDMYHDAEFRARVHVVEEAMRLPYNEPDPRWAERERAVRAVVAMGF